MESGRLREEIEKAEALLSARAGLLELWQNLADHFYPERADFTVGRTLGEDFASHLATSRPVLCRRDLGNLLSSMLRPPESEWFKCQPRDDALRDLPGVMAWCERATTIMRRAMQEPAATFTRATKEADHDFATFGQAALTVEVNSAGDGLLYRTWHLRDMAWSEGPEGRIDTVVRRFKPSARNLLALWPKTAADAVREVARKTPEQPVDCLHIVRPSEGWEWSKKPRRADRFPFVCVYIDTANNRVLEETPMMASPWVIPRWSTVSGSQYAYSPAAIATIADARLMQTQTMVLLEAGEKSNDPPIIAKRDIFQSAPNLFAGGITYADLEGDEKLGDILDTMAPSREGHVSGMELIERTEKSLMDGWFLDRLFLPPPASGEQMTAAEVDRRTQEFIRHALPLFEPVEVEYNTPVCENTFNLLLVNGAFPRMPDALRGKEVEFIFESPLRQAKGRADVQRFQELAGLSQIAAQIDPSLIDNANFEQGYRDALRGIGATEAWQNDPEAVATTRAKRAQAAALKQAMETVQAGAQVAGEVGNAAEALTAGGLLRPQDMGMPQGSA